MLTFQREKRLVFRSLLLVQLFLYFMFPLHESLQIMCLLPPLAIVYGRQCWKCLTFQTFWNVWKVSKLGFNLFLSLIHIQYSAQMFYRFLTFLINLTSRMFCGRFCGEFIGYFFPTSFLFTLRWCSKRFFFRSLDYFFFPDHLYKRVKVVSGREHFLSALSQ